MTGHSARLYGTTYSSAAKAYRTAVGFSSARIASARPR